MHITLLSRGSGVYTTRRIVEAARERGHRIRVLDPLGCEMHLDKNGPTVYHRGRLLPRTDVVSPRIAASINLYGLAVVNHFTTMGVPALNDSRAIAQARNKMRCLQLLSSSGVDVPATVMVARAGDPKSLVKMVGGLPVLVRRLQAEGWSGVMLAEDLHSMQAVLETMLKLGEHLVIQQYTRPRHGMDLRVLVVGGKVVCAVRRKIRPGRFARTLKGAEVTPADLTLRAQKVAVSAARIVGLEVAAVDMLELPEGPRVFELHSSPGLRDMEEATGRDLAMPILDRAVAIAQHARRAAPRPVAHV